MDFLPLAYRLQYIGYLQSYLSSMQLLEVIRLIWEIKRPVLGHGLSDGSKMALKAGLQTVQ